MQSFPFRLYRATSVALALALLPVAANSSTSDASTDKPMANTPVSRVQQGVWLDEQGQELALFGVNYAQPFAFGYRAVAAKGLSHRDVMAMDVAHLKRLGITAYRVHLWDRLLSDADGNLLNNEHLQLFDELLELLRAADIRVIITPIGWWGSGYPAPDPKEPGFSALFDKNAMNEQPRAIAATKTYLRQLMAHVNRAGYRYQDDPNILAFELFNEPKHRQAPAVSAAYVTSLVNMLRELGVGKPLFYNVSEQGNWPEFASAICQSAIDGIAYQWYPTSLLHQSRLTSAPLLSVAQYTDPFGRLPACADKARMVYEFDAADVDSPVMYPAMATAFRAAGFQWATQFAYDSAALADSNAEYNTHYLNLLYTPAKAISLAIAGQLFATTPRGDAREHSEQSLQPRLPATLMRSANTSASRWQLDPSQDLAWYQSKDRLYYTASLPTPIADATSLQHIAGVGRSSLVDYAGTGAYFIDRQADGSYLLELYPDVIRLQDAYQPSSLQREVARLYLSSHPLQLKLPGLSPQTMVTALAGPALQGPLQQTVGNFQARPGRYHIGPTLPLKNTVPADAERFWLPTITEAPVSVTHQGPRQWPRQAPLTLCAQIASSHPLRQVQLFYRYQGQSWQTPIHAKLSDQLRYCASVPSQPRSGALEYRFSVQQAHNEQWLSAGASGSDLVYAASLTPGKPDDWDFTDNDQSFRVQLVNEHAAIPLFDAEQDRQAVVYLKDSVSLIDWRAGPRQQGQALRVSVPSGAPSTSPLPLVQLQLSRQTQQALHQPLSGYQAVQLRVRLVGASSLDVGVALLDQRGFARGSLLPLTERWQDVQLPLSALTEQPTWLGQAYPTFQAATRLPASDEPLELSKLQGVQIWLPQPPAKAVALEIAEVHLIAVP